MGEYEKKYYESDEFWKGAMLKDSGNTLRIQMTASMIPSNVRSLLDVGCGNGVFGDYLKNNRSDIFVIGMDRSETALSFVSTEKMVGEITQIPSADSSYDCVSCLQVLEHIPVELYKLALSELARVATKYLLISVPYQEKLEDNVSHCPGCRTVFNSDLHMRSYSEVDIANMFLPNGFKLLRFENIVESSEFAGKNIYRALKNIIKPTRPVFNSPICPVCGLVNESFSMAQNEGGAAKDQQKTLQKSGIALLKKTLRSVWPRKKVPGYWAIALYEKIEI